MRFFGRNLRARLQLMSAQVIAIVHGLAAGGLHARKAQRAVEKSGGAWIAVSDGEILAAMRLLGRSEGVFGEPAGVTATAGVKKAVEQGIIRPDETVVSICTGSGLPVRCIMTPA